jgi:SAM-dependent methyltransferase
MACMDLCIRKYMRKDRKYDVLDFGSFVNHKQVRNHRVLLRDYRCKITGVDIQAGRNVDKQMTQPYRIPVRSRSQDVVMSGQVFEHVPFPFSSMLEIARVLRPGGYFFVTVPSRGHRHSTYDLWRYYPDSMRALAAYAGLELVEVHTDMPPRPQKRFDYAAIDSAYHYWGDTTGVMRKPSGRTSFWAWLHRWVELRYTNGIGDLEGTPIPDNPRPTRRRRRVLQERLQARLKEIEGREAARAHGVGEPVVRPPRDTPPPPTSG